MNRPEDSPLGRATAYPSRYDPGLLYPIPRAAQRERLGSLPRPMHGHDRWMAWELGWRDARGKPQVAVGRLVVPADSPRLIESKSLKLYLNSLADQRFSDAEALCRCVVADLSAAAGALVQLDLYAVDDRRLMPARLPGACIDALDIDIADLAAPDPALLRADPARRVDETLHSHLLKSNCPVTGQPDWASLVLHYQGAAIDRAGLLRYLVGYRHHQDFHEHCVERIFADVLRACAPQQLTVEALYTRRGGLDINPLRATAPRPPGLARTLRQ